MEELLEYLRTRDAKHDREQWLTRRAYTDARHPDYLLNARTKRLRPAPDEEAKVPGQLPLAVFLALPDPPFSEIVDPRKDDIWTWLSDHSRRYMPDPQAVFLRGSAKAALDGIIFAEQASESNSRLRSYVVVERIGAVEMGIGDVLYKTLDATIVFRYTALVGYLWQFLSFATDLYGTFRQEKPFTLLVGLRATEGSLLGGLGKGWKEPFPDHDYRPVCREPGILICKDNLGPGLSPEMVADLVRDVATRIDNAWGERKPRCYATAQRDAEERFDVDQFRDLSWR